MGLGPTCLSWLVVAGLLQCHVVQAASVAAGCSIPGFTFKQNQVPTVTFHWGLHGDWNANPVHLLTLPYKPIKDEERSLAPKPFTNTSATAAACNADAACGMFTSDGYIIGAYRTSVEAGLTEKESIEANFITWQPMYYCTWPCCGTWVADGLIAQLLKPVPLSSAHVNGVESLKANDLPQDSELQYTMKADVLQKVCVGKSGILEKSKVTSNATGGSACPSRCPVACCKQLANTSDPNRNSMGQYHFSQCSGTVCNGCEYIGGTEYPSNVANILMRRYVREISRHSAGVQPGNTSGCKPDGNSAAKRGVPSLC